MNVARVGQQISKLRHVFMLLCLLFVNSGSVQTVQAAAGDTTSVSVVSNGTQGNAFSEYSSISADGRYVAFDSHASNLVSGDTNGTNDVFVYDRQTEQTTRVSVALDGIQGNGGSGRPSISADGRYVAFGSAASNLVSGDTNRVDDIFVYDRLSGQTTRASVASDGTQGNGRSGYPSQSISADARYIAFGSVASNLVSGDTNGTWDIFVHDQQSGQTTRVSVASDGTQGNDESHHTSISADGHYVAFDSYASNLVSGDTNGGSDMFIHDQQSRQTTRVSVASDGTQGDNASFASSTTSISADGHYMMFESYADNLVSGDTNSFIDIFVYDRQSGQTTLVSVASDGTQGNDDASFPSISADGRYVAFGSGANNLVSEDTNGWVDVFIHDRQNGQTTRVSVASDGTQGNRDSGVSSISADGRYVAFASSALNLVSGDTNNTFDVFVHDMQTGITTRVSVGSDTGFTISGNAGIANANLSYTDGVPKTATSALDGSYSFTVSSGWSGTVTPSKMGHTFSLPNLTYTNVQSDQSNQNYTATQVNPPIVLVHGWHGKPIIDPTDTCTSATVAHHMTNPDSIPSDVVYDFGVFAKNLISDHKDVWVVHVATGPGGTPLLEKNAACLKQQLIDIRERTKAQKVILIAHSMGGLVSRAYIESTGGDAAYMNDVAQLITLGSPHGGTSYMYLFCGENQSDFASCQMTPKGMLFFNASHYKRAEVTYDLIGGNSTPAFLWLGTSLSERDGPNDGVVGVNSGMGLGYPGFPDFPKPIVGGEISRFAIAASHSSLLSPVPLWFPSFFNQLSFPFLTIDEKTPTDTYKCIKQLLGIAGGSCPSATTNAMTFTTTSASELQTDAVPKVQATPTISGHIMAGETVTVSVPIDASGQSNFNLTWTTGTLNFSLINPNGMAIDPAYTAAHPSEVAYMENIDPSAIADESFGKVV